MTLLVLTGSTRKGSYTRLVGHAVADLARDAQVGEDLSRLPFFNQDLEDEPPASVERLRGQVRDADVVVIVTPEYNGAVPGVVGNALDWLSRPYEQGALTGKPVVAVTASPGQAGGRRALTALTGVLDNLGATTVAQIAICNVDARVSAGSPDQALTAQLRDLIASLGSAEGLAA